AVVDQVRDRLCTLCRTTFCQSHDLVKYHQEVLHTQYHVNREERNDQRESQILEFRPSGSPVNRACLIYILRYSLKTGNINNSIHCHRLPACYKYDGQPCAAFTGKHTAGEETDSQLLSHCREDVSKNKADNISYNQPAQYVRNEIDSPQSTFPFNLTVQSKS